MTDMAECPLTPGERASPTGLETALPEPIMLAVPKKGRLHERIMQIVKGAGLHHVRVARLDVAKCTSQPVTIVFLPAADIAKCVCVLGIVQASVPPGGSRPLAGVQLVPRVPPPVLSRVPDPAAASDCSLLAF